MIHDQTVDKVECPCISTKDMLTHLTNLTDVAPGRVRAFSVYAMFTKLVWGDASVQVTAGTAAGRATDDGTGDVDVTQARSYIRNSRLAIRCDTISGFVQIHS